MPKQTPSRIVARARVSPDGPWKDLPQRECQTLQFLSERGKRGATSAEFPGSWARRTSGYVKKLRNKDFPIDTLRETASDGVRIGRYVLTKKVEISLIRPKSDGGDDGSRRAG